MRLPARIAVYLLVGVAVLAVLFPLLWMLAAALKTNAQIIDVPQSLGIRLTPAPMVNTF